MMPQTHFASGVPQTQFAASRFHAYHVARDTYRRAKLAYNHAVQEGRLTVEVYEAFQRAEAALEAAYMAQVG